MSNDHNALEALIEDYLEAGGILMKMRLADGIDTESVKTEMLQLISAARQDRERLVELLQRAGNLVALLDSMVRGKENHTDASETMIVEFFATLHPERKR